MRLHPHIWKYFSSKHRLCRICGEPEKFQSSRVIGTYWGSIAFDEWIKEYPEQSEIDKANKIADEASERRLKRLYDEDRKKGKIFLHSLSSSNADKPTKKES